jgi:hypothetical protein
MNRYSSLHFYTYSENKSLQYWIKKVHSAIWKKKQVDVHLSKTEHKIFLNLVGVEVFWKLSVSHPV